jgi:dephospho-CoA kinase
VKVIGLTGNIGCGKSSVARFLQELGAGFIDADQVGHDIYDPGTPGWQAVVQAFGSDILDETGRVDRKKLSQKVFNSPDNLKKLNELLHPLIRRQVENALEQFRLQGKEVTVLEAILLVEAGWREMVDQLWLVVAPKDLTLSRLEGRGLPESEALARMARQPPAEERLRYADVVIRNDGDLDDLRKQVEKLWSAIHNDNKKAG